MKWIACLIIIAVGVSSGVSAALNMSERVKHLVTIRRFIKNIGEMTEYSPQNIDKMTEKILRTRQFDCCSIVSGIDLALMREKGFEFAWEDTLCRNKSLLKLSDRELLSEFGSEIGRGSCDIQARHCEYCLNKLDDVIKHAEDECRQKSRLYISLGTMAGIFAVIMLI